MAYTIKIKDIPTAKIPIKCPYPMDAIGFCIHNTANDASAENEISYMQKNDNYTSYHYAIDDRHVVRGLPLERNSWHAGDGSTGEGNRKYIGIEICYSKSGGERYHQAEQNAVDFLAYELYLRGWGVDRVKKHQDFSGKYCPHRILNEGRWDSFKKEIQAQVDGYYKMAEGQSQPPAGLYKVQVGAYRDKSNAEKKAEALRKQGHEVYIVHDGKTDVKPSKPALKSVSIIAKEVIDGKWGNGQVRKDRLKKAGYDPVKVQTEVNRILGGKR